VTAEQQQGLSFEEAHAAVPVAKVIKNKVFYDGSYGGDRELPMDVMGLDPKKLGDLYHEDVVNTLKAQVAELQDHLKNHKSALDIVREELRAEKASKFSEPGWFLPKEMLTDGAASSLEHLIAKAKQTSVVNVVASPGAPYEVQYEADWVKYLRPIQPAATQSWIMKLGSAVAKFHEPSVINRVDAAKQEGIIKRLMTNLGEPNSVSLAEAFKQFANEICFGHVSLESLVQKAAGNEIRVYTDAVALERLQDHPAAEVVFGKKRREEAPNTANFLQLYSVPAERLAGNISASNDENATEPVYSEQALLDPTTVQKAMLMGMVGTDDQQAEARVFLRQHVQLTTKA
jgi:hypothetical protein